MTAYNGAMIRKKLLIYTLTFAFCLLFGLGAETVHGQDVVTDLIGRINNLRSSLGLAPYSLNGALNAAAQNHASWMAETGQVSHTQPNGSTPSTRAAAAGYASSWVSENIYAGTNATANDAWVFWINSPIHYRGLTNSNYDQIGIGSATTSWGRSFVLVFGASGAPAVNLNPGGGGDSGAAPAAAPSFIVGVDSYGNIMHEVQEEHTVGDIALIYGYTWDDIPGMLTLNGLTETDLRTLKIGSIFLVPPHSGTYTPTPGGPTVTPGVAPEDLTAIAEAVANTTALPGTTGQPDGANLNSDITPSSTETPRTRVGRRAMTRTAEAMLALTVTLESGNSVNGVVVPRIATSGAVPAELNSPTIDASVATAQLSSPSPTLFPTVTLTITPTSEPAISSAFPTVATEVAMVGMGAGTDAPALAAPGEIIILREGTSPWLIVALVLQSVIIGFAAFQFARRMRR